MSAQVKIKKTILMDQITKAYGNLAAVARTMRLSRNTIYVFIEKKGNEDVKKHLEDVRESMIDNVESALYSKALNGDTTSMIFFLKTQGHKRGYIERHEIGGITEGDEAPRPVSIQIVNPTPNKKNE